MSTAHGRAGSGLLDRIRSGMNFSFGGGRSLVGLSIGASSIKVVELKKKKKQWQLLKYASVSLTDIPGEHREISNPTTVINAIQSAMKQAGISSKNVCSAIAGSGLIIKNLMVTIADMKELQDQVFWEAEQYIPYDITEVVIDFQVIGEKKGDQVEVILVAVKKDFLEQYMSVIEQSKLNPKIMDTELFALQNAFEANYPVSSTESVLLADVGAISTKIVICGNGIPFFTKDAPFGGIAVTQEIQKELNLPRLQDAESLKVSTNLPQEVRDVLNRTAQNLAGEIKKAIDFYTASSLGPPVTKVYLSGGGSRMDNLPRTVKEYTSIPCDFMNPFQEVGIEIKDFTGNISQEVVIPMGLAIRAGAE
jgi:type IV pilus assembly protein PilM